VLAYFTRKPVRLLFGGLRTRPYRSRRYHGQATAGNAWLFGEHRVRFGNLLAMQVDARSSRRNVRFWRKADINGRQSDVRF